MKNTFLVALAFCCLLIVGCKSKKRDGNPKVLVFSKTMGFKHSAIPDGIAAIQKLGAENNFEVDTTKNAAIFEEDSLQQYSAIIFMRFFLWSFKILEKSKKKHSINYTISISIYIFTCHLSSWHQSLQIEPENS